MAKILLVDDDTSMRSMVARALTSDGHIVTEAGDGEAALEVLGKTTDFTVLLTDVQMPGMDGLTLAAKASAAAPALHVIVISALEQDAVRTGKLGPKARWLAKPFTLDQIRAEVRQALA
jgi:two-component system, cell cycle sensor histidine kinase and response regulator CckA